MWDIRDLYYRAYARENTEAWAGVFLIILAIFLAVLAVAIAGVALIVTLPFSVPLLLAMDLLLGWQVVFHPTTVVNGVMTEGWMFSGVLSSAWRIGSWPTVVIFLIPLLLIAVVNFIFVKWVYTKIPTLWISRYGALQFVSPALLAAAFKLRFGNDDIGWLALCLGGAALSVLGYWVQCWISNHFK